MSNLNLEWPTLNEELKTETVISGCCWEVKLVCVMCERKLCTYLTQVSFFFFCFNHMHVLFLFSLLAFKIFLFIFDVTHLHSLIYSVLLNIFIFIPPVWSTVYFLNPENLYLFSVLDNSLPILWTMSFHFCFSLISQFSHIRITIRICLKFWFLFFPHVS